MFYPLIIHCTAIHNDCLALAVIVIIGSFSSSPLPSHLWLQPWRLGREWYITDGGTGGGGDWREPVWLVVGESYQCLEWGDGGGMGAGQLLEVSTNSFIKNYWSSIKFQLWFVHIIRINLIIVPWLWYCMFRALCVNSMCVSMFNFVNGVPGIKVWSHYNY